MAHYPDGDWDAEEEDYVLDDVECLHATDRAILVRIGEDKEWIPKSQLRDGNEVLAPGDAGTLVISGWLAQQKDWV